MLTTQCLSVSVEMALFILGVLVGVVGAIVAAASWYTVTARRVVRGESSIRRS